MRKTVYLDSKAKKSLDKLPQNVREEFYARFLILQLEGKLEMPYAKKINKQLFEIRVKIDNIYRGFYAYTGINQVIILHIFNKKTQKTPLKEILLATKRLTAYEK
jgi:phage-related protein